jgi:5'(3')-deoxyribonucleotidase
MERISWNLRIKVCFSRGIVFKSPKSCILFQPINMKQITEEVVEEFTKKTNVVIFTNNPKDIQLIETISKKYSKKFNFFYSNDTNLSG